jgi:hypothetical protein
VAALDFPSSPTVGQTYTANGKTWQWDGVSWNSFNTIVAAGANTQIQYNNAGSFGASSSLTWNNSTSTFGTANIFYTGTLTGGTGVITIGTNQIYKDASGNVGIGTSSPAATLDIRASSSGVRIGNYNFAGINIFGSSVNTSGVYLGLDSGGGFATNVRDAGYLAYSTNNTERLRINSSGNVGIGAVPDSSLTPRLYVTGTFGAASAATGYGGLYITSTDSVAANKGGVLSLGGVYVGTTDTRYAAIAGLKDNATSNEYGGYLALYTRPNGDTPKERLRISSSGVVTIGSAISLDPTTANSLVVNSSGNVGIGTSSPGTRLDVLCATNGGFRITDGTQTCLLTPSGVGGIALYATSNHPLVFGTNNAERMRIDTSGNVQVSSDAGNTLRYFDVANANTGSSAGSIIRLITSNAAGTTSTSVDIVKYKFGALTINNNESNSAAYTSFGVGASERMRITSAGNLLVNDTVERGGKVVVTNTPTSQWGIDQSGSQITLTNGANAVLATGSGLIVLNSHTTGDAAVYLINGSQIYKLGGTASYVVSSTPSAGQVGVGWTGSSYAIYNNVGSTQTFGIAMIRTRAAV